jgi:hypothetical protein
MADEKRVTVNIRRIEGGYEVSFFLLPPEIYFAHALRHGFETVGWQTARVHIDSTASVENPKGKDWLIHHEDSTRADPDKVLNEVQDVLKEWLGGLGYKIEFRSGSW